MNFLYYNARVKTTTIIITYTADEISVLFSVFMIIDIKKLD